MAGESNLVDDDTVKDSSNSVNNNQNDNDFADKSSKSDLPDFKLTVQNPVSPRILLFSNYNATNNQHYFSGGYLFKISKLMNFNNFLYIFSFFNGVGTKKVTEGKHFF